MIRIQIKKVLIYVFIIAFAICPTFAFDDKNRNILLVGIMATSPIIIMFYRGFYRSDFYLILFMFSIVVFPLFVNPSSMRWSTVIYSCLFCLSFMAYRRLINIQAFDAVSYQNILRALIYAYVITLLIQQFCVLTGLPIFNLRFYNPADPWKLNSLGAEPSWAGRILALLMYSYLTIKEITVGKVYNFKTHFRQDRWVWLGFLWTMITMGSATALLFLGIVIMKLLSTRNILKFAVLIASFMVIADNLDVQAYERTKNTILATVTLDEATIIKADHSASFRIVPMIVLAKKVTLLTVEGWFGHGVDYIVHNVDLKVPGSKNMTGGGFFGVFIEYGFLAFMLFMLFSMPLSINKNIVSFIFWFMLVFIYGLNVQIPWLAIMLLYTNNYCIKYFKKNRRSDYESQKNLS